MVAATSFADLRKLCEDHDCTPALRSETRNGRIYVSLSAVQKSAPNKTMYDIRSDQAWDDFLAFGAIVDQAFAEWWA